jgi:hypothetical protein
MARRAPSAILAIGLLALLLAAPSAAWAHVNRTVGPYQILVVLVEEPTFEDDHAGFKFWVRDSGVAVTGLERTLRAQAARTDVTVDLAIAPVDASGFYVLDRDADGSPFDPRGGGAWFLRLTGVIGTTPVEEAIPVLFPSYPRSGAVATGGTSPVAATTAATQGGGVPVGPLVGVAVALLAIVIVVGIRFLGRRKPAV